MTCLVSVLVQLEDSDPLSKRPELTECHRVTLTAGASGPGLSLAKSCKLSQSSIIGSALRPALTSHLDSLTWRNAAWLKKGEGRDYCCGSLSCPRLVGRHRSPTPPAPLLKTFTACPDAPDTCLRLGGMNGGIKSPLCTGRHATLGELPWKPNLFLQV